MLVKEVMTRDVEYVTNENTLQEAAEKMKELDVGELPIAIGNEAVGVLTDRDIVIRSIAHGNDPKVAKVIDAMTEGIIACYEDDKIEKAAKSMGKHRVRRLPVLNENGNITGMISIGDLASNLDNSLVGEVLMEISK
ncbi:MAG: CBS domain-containing protein [Desulfosarcina sp.]|jgi:CBS domain-containing protein